MYKVLGLYLVLGCAAAYLNIGVVYVCCAALYGGTAYVRFIDVKLPYQKGYTKNDGISICTSFTAGAIIGASFSSVSIGLFHLAAWLFTQAM